MASRTSRTYQISSRLHPCMMFPLQEPFSSSDNGEMAGEDQEAHPQQDPGFVLLVLFRSPIKSAITTPFYIEFKLKLDNTFINPFITLGYLTVLGLADYVTLIHNCAVLDKDSFTYCSSCSK